MPLSVLADNKLRHSCSCRHSGRRSGLAAKRPRRILSEAASPHRNAGGGCASPPVGGGESMARSALLRNWVLRSMPLLSVPSGWWRETTPEVDTEAASPTKRKMGRLRLPWMVVAKSMATPAILDNKLLTACKWSRAD